MAAPLRLDRIYGPGERDEYGLCVLPPDIKQKAVDELHEPTVNSERIAFLDEMRETIKADARFAALPHPVRTDYPYLLRFARARKYNLMRAVDQLYNFEHLPVEFNLEFDPVKCAPMVTSFFQCFTPVRTLGGAKVVYMRINLATSVPLTNYDFTAAGIWLMRHYFSLETDLEDEVTQICGMVIVEDLAIEDGSMTTIPFEKDVMNLTKHAMENCYPMRFPGIYLLHPPWYIKPLLALFGMFLGSKMRNRIKVMDTPAELEQFIDRRNLPTVWGGDFDIERGFETFMSIVCKDLGVPYTRWDRIEIKVEKPAPGTKLGLDVFTHETPLMGGRVEVLEVFDDGFGARIGLRPGDRICKVNTEFVKGVKDIDIFSAKDEVTIIVARRCEMPYAIDPEIDAKYGLTPFLTTPAGTWLKAQRSGPSRAELD